jgi:hypothetical protein
VDLYAERGAGTWVLERVWDKDLSHVKVHNLSG